MIHPVAYATRLAGLSSSCQSWHPVSLSLQHHASILPNPLEIPTMLRLSLAAFFCFSAGALAQDDGAAFKRQKDVIYGRKHGVVLTMDVFTPTAKPNGAGVVWCVSGGWFSSH